MLAVVNAGDIACNPFNIEEALGRILAGADELLQAASGLLAPAAITRLRCLCCARCIALLHFDADLDTWDTYFGAPSTHGTPFRRAAEEGLPLDDRNIHVGTRGPLYAASDLCNDRMLGFAAVIDRVRARLGDDPVYASVDIDVLDPAYAPANGTPEAGGLSSRDLLSCWPLSAGCGACASSRLTSSKLLRRTIMPKSRRSPPHTLATSSSAAAAACANPSQAVTRSGSALGRRLQSARAGKTPGTTYPEVSEGRACFAVGSPPWQAQCDDCFRQELSSVTGTWSPQFPLPGVIGGCAAEDPGVQTRRRLCRKPAFICLWSPPAVHRPHRLGETPSATQM